MCGCRHVCDDENCKHTDACDSCYHAPQLNDRKHA